MLVEVTEVFLRLFRGRCAETLVILYTERASLSRAEPFLPLGELCDRIEALAFAGRGRFDDRGDELTQEALAIEEAGEEVLEEVDQEAFDVRAVVILISHNHNAAVAE